MIIHTESDKDRAARHIKALNIDKPWSMEIKPYKKNRSVAQNKLMWLWFKVIGDDLGYTENEVYFEMTEMFLSYEEKKRFNGDVVMVKCGTSGLDTKEFTAFLQHVDRWAVSEMGIILPSPEELIWEAMGIKKKIDK